MEPVDAPDAECAKCGWDNHNRVNGNAALEQTILKDQYMVGKSLGRGGFGITYVGFDITLERRIAIKEYFPVGTAYRFSDGVTIRAYTEAEEDYQNGLNQALQESRTIAKLGQIPNVMQVHNAFLENGTVYMIMEYIEGISLTEEVKQKGKLSWKEALHRLYPIMDALEKIHARGMIHRDISPENIIRRSETGEPVLLDFGSARQPKEGLTVMLKPGYAPAEQYSRNGEQDGRVDEYALCATMYYLVTGSAPASADLRLFAKKELKRPSEYADDIPAEFEKVLLKGMELDSSDRYPSVKELHDAFLKAEQEARKSGRTVKPLPPRSEKIENHPEKREKTGFPKKIAAIVAAIAVACLGGFLLFGNASRDRNTEEEAAVSSTQENPAVVDEKETAEAEEKAASMPEPTAINTPTPEPTATNTPTPEPTATNTPTPGPTATNTPTPEPTEIQVPAGPPRMRSENHIDYDNRDKATVLGSKVLRSEITEVKIEESLTNAPSTAWDVSEIGDRSVLAWVNETLGGKTLTIAGEGGVSAPEDSSELFYYYINMQKADLNGLDTSNVSDMCGMFSHCSGLTNLDISTFDTSNVTDMGSMFGWCKSLKKVDMSNFDTSNVTRMYGMFQYCITLKSINVSNFNTSNVTDMGGMFRGCYSLRSIDVSNFDTSRVTNMTQMFMGCDALTSIDVSNFDTSNVTDMSDMFYSCENLAYVDVSNFDTSNVTDMTDVF